MVDVTYRETRIIRPHTDEAMSIDVTCKCDSISDIAKLAKYVHKSKECVYAVCDNILYFLDGRNEAGYLVTRVVNV